MIETAVSEGENNLFMDILKENFGNNFEIDYTDKDRKPYIIVDRREKRSGIVEKLEILGTKVIVETLDSGDYLVSSNSGVERKRGDDYYKSFFSGSDGTNINEELIRLSDSVENPVLIIEDFTRMFNRGEEKISSLYGEFISIATHLKIPIIPTRNIDDTALVLYRMAIQLQGFTEHHGISRRIPKKISHKERQTYFIEGLYNIGPKKAKQIITQFKTPLKFLTALLKTEISYTKTGNPKGIKGDLQIIKGLGWKFVRDNKKLLIEQESEENSTN